MITSGFFNSVNGDRLYNVGEAFENPDTGWYYAD